MALRSFADPQGMSWDVWEVTSYAINPLDEAQAAPREPSANLVAVPGAGWLCFQRGAEKRRLAPIPARWAELPDAALADLLARAEPVRRRRTPNPPADRADG